MTKIDLFKFLTSTIKQNIGRSTPMASLTPNWRDNAGRRGNKRERIKRVPFNSRVRFHNTDLEGSVRSVWEESVRGAVDLARMLNTYACIYVYVYICEYNSRGDGPWARSLTSIRSRIKTKPGSLSVQRDTIRAAHALPMYIYGVSWGTRTFSRLFLAWGFPPSFSRFFHHPSQFLLD